MGSKRTNSRNYIFILLYFICYYIFYFESIFILFTTSVREYRCSF
nr:MAG TPA: hypothetical protein [Caudoviricetes sp.]